MLARAQQDAVWDRQQAANLGRHCCASNCPTLLAVVQGSDLSSSDARAALGLAPSPAAATTLRRPRLRAALARAGRRRNLDHQVERILAGLRAEQFHRSELIEQAMGQTALAHLRALNAAVANIVELAPWLLLAPDRMYRGAHYLTDALGGVVLALSWLLVTYRIVRPDYW